MQALSAAGIAVRSTFLFPLRFLLLFLPLLYSRSTLSIPTPPTATFFTVIIPPAESHFTRNLSFVESSPLNCSLYITRGVYIVCPGEACPGTIAY
ncbi:hypothetical protein P170DRAFT_265482 [Aspergillus steynii IBT 23096]|uniref:Uncharacterized protein n=1 Tax=Aspergillus steynii IBT 23096 TaxID=1392250 RepID=A0A2I2FVP7_9EURO|nr:uncharacterized protein P170DRAFT_265482 [Aspergillus steynii IBT 23096]PLB44710.1 hypothetical protein P170DRAFT_265482 [Aspergillus steynii IBT 23096]